MNILTLYNVSADGGRTWTTQWLTENDVLHETELGHVVERRSGMLQPRWLKFGSYIPAQNGMSAVIKKEWSGQGYVFKDEEAFFNRPDEVCYIPELVDDDETDNFFTGNDLLRLCGGDFVKAQNLFYCLDWQSPYTKLDEWGREEDEERDESELPHKTIEVTIRLTSPDTFRLEFYEPESSDNISFDGSDVASSELIRKVGNEILSWVSLMRDELE